MSHVIPADPYRKSFSDFIRAITEDSDVDLSQFLDSISEIETAISQSREEINQHQIDISELKNQISLTDERIRRLYSDLIGHFHSVNGSLRLSHIFQIWNFFARHHQGFQKTYEYSVSDEERFLESLNLNQRLWLGAACGLISWDTVEDLINGQNTGQTNYSIEGGLEIYRGEFPIDEQFLPSSQTPCLYMLRDSKSEVIYVGKSVNVRNRLTIHWREQLKEGMHSWEVIRMASYHQMDSEECRLILRFQPKHNKTMKNRAYSRSQYVNNSEGPIQL